MRNDLAKWDELNLLKEQAVAFFSGNRKRDRKQLERFCDYLEFVLCLAYVYGWRDAEEIVGIVPFPDGLDNITVNLEIKGETFRQRITADTTPEEILRIIDTEAHRDYNTGVFDAADRSGRDGIRKVWYTMMDDRVREQHQYLEGMVVGLHDLFYTDDGDSALFPGDFEKPENNVNCRCSVGLIA